MRQMEIDKCQEKSHFIIILTSRMFDDSDLIYVSNPTKT